MDIPRGVGDIEVSYGLSNPVMLADLLAFRLRFVQQMRWQVAESFESEHPFLQTMPDADRYDAMRSTLHLLSRDTNTGQIIAGLRLTPVASVESSLSWAMIQGCAAIHRHPRNDQDADRIVEELNGLAAEGYVWDLTRLVNHLGDGVDHMQIAAAMMELFGVALGIGRRNMPPDRFFRIRWIFTTTEDLKNALSSLGIEFAQLAAGVVDADSYSAKSYFCVVEPQRNVVAITANEILRSFTYPHMCVGLERAATL